MHRRRVLRAPITARFHYLKVPAIDQLSNPPLRQNIEPISMAAVERNEDVDQLQVFQAALGLTAKNVAPPPAIV